MGRSKIVNRLTYTKIGPTVRIGRGGLKVHIRGFLRGLKISQARVSTVYKGALGSASAVGIAACSISLLVINRGQHS